MILVVASELDTLAQDVVAEWPEGQAALLTLSDLCTRGWRIQVEAFDESQIVASGRICPVREVRGALVLLPYVMDYELFGIEDAERKYVASEMSAFLFYFLSRLPCPVLNRPTAHCLVGPSWRPEQWDAACLQAGIYAKSAWPKPRPEPATRDPAKDSTCISVVGSRVIGTSGGVSTSSVLELARLARVEFLTVRMEGDAQDQSLHSIELVPNLRNGSILEAIHSYFLG